MALIGISGKKNSGKDLVCKIIQWFTCGINTEENSFIQALEYWDDGIFSPSKYRWDNVWKKKMFAEKLKQIVCLLIGCTMEQLEDESIKGMTFKELAERGIISKEFLNDLPDD